MLGKPENAEAFVHFMTLDGIEVCLHRGIWESLKPGAEGLRIAVHDQGRFWLQFERDS